MDRVNIGGGHTSNGSSMVFMLSGLAGSWVCGHCSTHSKAQMETMPLMDDPLTLALVGATYAAATDFSRHPEPHV